MLRVFFALAMSATVAGQNSQFLPDQSKAEASKESIFAIIDRVSAVDPMSEEGLKPGTCHGAIEFRDVTFSYPSRPDVVVLKVRHQSTTQRRYIWSAFTVL